MGKMKRARDKLHAAAKKKKATEQHQTDGDDQDMADVSQLMPPPDPTALGARGENLFKDVKITGNLLAQKLPDFDARSTITSKTFRGQNLKKKEKLQLRREAWMQKMDTISTTKKKAKEKKKKEQTPIVGDLTNFEDALPTLELLMKKSTDTSKPEEKPRPIPKEKKRKKQMMDDISLFQQVLHHPLFQKDAASTIQDHLKAKLKAERERSMDS